MAPSKSDGLREWNYDECLAFQMKRVTIDAISN